MKKSLHYLFVTTLAVGLAAGISWAAKPDKPGGGGNGGGGNPSYVAVIAKFDTSSASNLVPDNIVGSYGQYDSTNVGGGFVAFPGTGNFVIELQGGRTATFDLREALGDEPTESGWADFTKTYGATGTSEVVDDRFSINRHCLVQDLNADFGCGNLSTSDGSLRDLQFDDSQSHAADGHQTDLILRFTPLIPNPENNKSRFQLNCGANTSEAPDPLLGQTTTFMVAHCNQPKSSQDSTCAEWRIVPYYGGAIDLGPVADSPANVCTLVGSVTQGRSTTITPLRDFDFRFGLTVYLDENRDAVPDVLPVVQ